MGLEALAAGMVITVKDQTAKGIAAVGRGFSSLDKRSAGLSKAFGGLNSLVTQFGVASGVVGIVLGVASKQAVDFEKALSAVRAVSSPDGDFASLTNEIKRLGATTQFSASEAAQGAENLTRAGFNTSETIEGLGGVLSAAAADGIDLATSAKLIANNVRAFGLDAKDAGMVADVLAQTSARTNTNMVELGEGLKYVAPIARDLGISVADTSAALGILADAGLQGSVGGTSLKNMLIQIAKPSAEAAKLIKKYGIETYKTADGSFDLTRTMDALAKTFDGIPDKMTKVAVAQELFGIRGQAAAGNFVAVIDKMGGSLQGRFDQIQAGTEGAAKRMAAIRVDNVAGAFTLLGSALEGLSIELFSGQMGQAKDAIMNVAGAIGVVVETLQQARDGFVAESESMTEFRDKFGPLTDTLIAFGLGMAKGLDTLKSWGEQLSAFAEQFAGAFGDTDLAGKIGEWLTIATPVIVVLGGLAGAIGLLAIPIATFGTTIMGALEFAGIGAAGLVGAFGLFAGTVNNGRAEGESFGEAMIRTFGEIRTFATEFFAGIQKGYTAYIAPSFGAISEAGAAMLDALKPIFDVVGESFGGMSGEGESMAMGIANAIGTVAKVVAWFVSNVLAPVIKFFANNFVAGFISGIGDLVGGFVDLVTGATSVGDALTRIFGGIFKTIVNAFLGPLRGAIDLVIKAAEAFGLGDNAIVSGAKDALEVLRFKEGLLGPGQVDSKPSPARPAPSAAALVKPAAAQAAASAPTINVENKPADQKIDIKNKMCVDGKEIAAANGRAEIENLERLGGVQTPFFNRAVRSGGSLSPSGR